MRGFGQLVICQIKLLTRNTGYLVGSFGIALISMVVFGSLFGSDSSSQFSMGFVDEDKSPFSQQLAQSLKGSDAFNLMEGDRDSELASLRDGKRRLVMVVGPGFSQDLAQRQATLQVYYDRGNLVAAATANAAVRAIVENLNQAITGTVGPIKVVEEGITAKRLRNIDFLTPGLVGMMIMWANMFVGVGLITWRERGVLKRLGVTPLRPFNLIASQITAHLAFSFLQAALLLALGIAIYGVTIEGSYLLLALTIGMGSLSMLGVGYVIGSFIRNSESANSVSMLVSFPMMFLGGSFFPLDTAPGFFQPLIQALPLTYLNHALRQVVNDGAGIAAVQTDLLVLLGWMVACLIVSTRVFRWQ